MMIKNDVKTIGVIISKGPNAKDPPRVLDENAHRNLLKALYNVIGKPAPWENTKLSIQTAGDTDGG